MTAEISCGSAHTSIGSMSIHAFFAETSLHGLSEIYSHDSSKSVIGHRYSSDLLGMPEVLSGWPWCTKQSAQEEQGDLGAVSSSGKEELWQLRPTSDPHEDSEDTVMFHVSGGVGPFGLKISSVG